MGIIKIVLIAIVLLHGLLHLIGFSRSLSKGGIIDLPTYMPRSYGFLWLLCALLFILIGFFLIFNIKGWIYFMSAALLISQVLISLTWKEAKYGTLVNIIILALSIFYLSDLLS